MAWAGCSAFFACAAARPGNRIFILSLVFQQGAISDDPGSFRLRAILDSSLILQSVQ